MKKIIYIIILLYPFSLNSLEKTKEEKVAKYVIENIQKDYIACYSFYKVSAESFKKAGREKNITFTDEANAMEFLGYAPLMVKGSSENLKLTEPEDMIFASAILEAQEKIN